MPFAVEDKHLTKVLREDVLQLNHNDQFSEANSLNHHESSFYSEILLATDENCIVFFFTQYFN